MTERVRRLTNKAVSLWSRVKRVPRPLKRAKFWVAGRNFSLHEKTAPLLQKNSAEALEARIKLSENVWRKINSQHVPFSMMSEMRDLDARIESLGHDIRNMREGNPIWAKTLSTQQRLVRKRTELDREVKSLFRSVFAARYPTEAKITAFHLTMDYLGLSPDVSATDSIRRKLERIKNVMAIAPLARVRKILLGKK